MITKAKYILLKDNRGVSKIFRLRDTKLIF